MKKTKSLLCLLLAVMMLMLCACSSGSATVRLSGQDTSSVSSEKKGAKELYIETKDKNKLSKIAKSGMTVLYFDEKNYSVSVYDANSKKLWSSLPEKLTDGAPAVLSVDVYIGAKKLTLNSQTDSVKRKLASFKKDKNELTVTYKFEKKLSESSKLSFSVPVRYSVADGAMTVSVDCSKIKPEPENKNTVISSIKLLDYFGSSAEGKSGDFIFVPEGSGAVISTAEKVKTFKRITVPVYGSDAASGEKSELCARIATFGVKKGESAFVALVEKGDAVSKITATKALKKGSYNSVGAVFDITKVKTSDETVCAASKAYDGEIKIVYRFLSGSNASYAAMASACREQLIRNGTLSFQKSSLTDEYPFVLSLIAAAAVGTEKTKTKTFTTVDEATEMISFFRSKGMDNIILRYRGMFGGDLFQSDLGKLKYSSRLGSKKELEEFRNFCSLQNIRVYPEVSFMSAKSSKVKDSAVSFDGKKVTLEAQKLKSGEVISKGEIGFSAPSSFKKRTNSLLFKLSDSFDGICFADVGNYLYTDYSSGSFTSRTTASQTLASQVSSVSSRKSVMIDGGNIYSVKYADMIVNLPNSSKLSSVSGCTGVPFLQILLHGVIPYSGKAANLCKNSDTAVLKAAEYGELLSYEFYYANEETDDAKDKLYYINYSTHTQNSYERLSEIYSGISSKEITNHYRVKKGVYCTEYGDDISIYVNYNNKDVKAGGVTIEARSFLKVE